MNTIPVLPLSVTNREALRRHFLALDDEDLRLRFEHAISETTLMQYVDSINFERDAVFGVFDENLELAGVAHLGLIDGIAEFGVSVIPGHRGEGIGTALYRRAYEYSRNHRIDTLFVHCLKENAAMMHIARKAGMEIQRDYGEADAYLKLSPPNPGSMLQEAVEEQFATIDYTLKANTRAAVKWLDRLPGRKPR